MIHMGFFSKFLSEKYENFYSLSRDPFSCSSPKFSIKPNITLETLPLCYSSISQNNGPHGLSYIVDVPISVFWQFSACNYRFNQRLIMLWEIRNPTATWCWVLPASGIPTALEPFSMLIILLIGCQCLKFTKENLIWYFLTLLFHSRFNAFKVLGNLLQNKSNTCYSSFESFDWQFFLNYRSLVSTTIHTMKIFLLS